MKKLLLIIVTTTVILSCNKKDDSTSVEGTWKLTSYTTDEPCDLNNDGVLSSNFMTESGCFNDSKLVFSAGNQVNVLLQEPQISVQIIAGTTNSYNFTTACLDATDDITTWSQNGNTVNIGPSGDDLPLTLSGNTLTASLPEFTEVQVVENGVVVYKVTGVTLVFTKQ